jgi:hypothetical protein
METYSNMILKETIENKKIKTILKREIKTTEFECQTSQFYILHYLLSTFFQHSTINIIYNSEQKISKVYIKSCDTQLSYDVKNSLSKPLSFLMIKPL